MPTISYQNTDPGPCYSNYWSLQDRQIFPRGDDVVSINEMADRQKGGAELKEPDSAIGT